MGIVRLNELPEGSGSLTNDDIFVFMDDPSGSGVTKKISLSQIASAVGGGGGGGNPFDQTLNTSDTVQFTGLNIGSTANIDLGSERGFFQNGKKFTLLSNNGGWGQFQAVNPDDGEVSFVLASNGTLLQGGDIGTPNSDNVWVFGIGSYSQPTTSFVISNNNTQSNGFIINGTGSVGIGKTPSYKLDVNGGVQFTQSYPTVTSLSIVNEQVDTDASAAQIFDITLTENVTLNNPTDPVDGVTIRWRIIQDTPGGRSVTLGNQFVIPSSLSSPLPWSTSANTMDILTATYHAVRQKWDIISFVSGY